MVVVVARIERENDTLVLVAPVTHSPPRRAADAIEIPASVKKQLGLDRERSWIILTELNRFIWPGPDVSPAARIESPFYDALPDWLFERVRQGMLRLAEAGRLKVTRRTE